MPKHGKKSLKRLIDEAMEAAENRETTLGSQLIEALDDVVWHEDEIVIFSETLVDIPGKLYRVMARGLRRRGFRIRKQKEVELRKDCWSQVPLPDRGRGVAEEAAVSAKLNGMTSSSPTERQSKVFLGTRILSVRTTPKIKSGALQWSDQDQDHMTQSS